jgi:multicomponent K+:H+ antiporter subunit F
MYINVVALVMLIGIRLASTMFFEAALLIALLGFASTVALSRYLSRGDVIE